MKKNILSLFTRFAELCVLLLFVGCEELTELSDDLTPPTILITTELSDIVSDTVIITVMVNDDIGIDKVELWVDGVNTNIIDDTEPYSLEWNTTTYEDNSSHILVVRVYDTSGNTADSDPISLTVNNMPSFNLEPSFQSVGIDSEASLSIELQRLKEPIFGITMQVNYDSSILSFNDSTGFIAGEYFDNQEIVFVNGEVSSIYMGFSIQQGGIEVSGSGTLCTLIFTGESAGTSEIAISLSNIHYFDSNGNEISIGDFELVPAIITVIS